MTDITLTVPWPPALNHYYRRWKYRTLISEQGRAYRNHIARQARAERWPSFGNARLKVTILASPPDKRRRDLDGMLKCLLDSLEHAGLYDDDGQIDDLRIVRQEPAKPGQCVVELEAA